MTASGDGSNSSSGMSHGDRSGHYACGDLARRISTIFSSAWLASSPLSSISASRSRRASRRRLRDVGAGDRRVGAVLVDELGPLDERLDHLALGHDGDVGALDEQVAALVAGGDAEVGLARLARPVDDAAHHRDLQRQLAIAERLHRPVGDVDHVDLGAAAARAGDQVDVLALAQAERLEQLAAGACLLDRIGGERVADRVADALEQQRRDARRSP